MFPVTKRRRLGRMPNETDENAPHAERFRLELDLHKAEFVFVGDSPNDQPMFDYFPPLCWRGKREEFSRPDFDQTGIRYRRPPVAQALPNLQTPYSCPVSDKRFHSA